MPASDKQHNPPANAVTPLTLELRLQAMTSQIQQHASQFPSMEGLASPHLRQQKVIEKPQPKWHVPSSKNVEFR
jgi:hypothetical protein